MTNKKSIYASTSLKCHKIVQKKINRKGSNKERKLYYTREVSSLMVSWDGFSGTSSWSCSISWTESTKVCGLAGVVVMMRPVIVLDVDSTYFKQIRGETMWHYHIIFHRTGTVGGCKTIVTIPWCCRWSTAVVLCIIMLGCCLRVRRNQTLRMHNLPHVWTASRKLALSQQ